MGKKKNNYEDFQDSLSHIGDNYFIMEDQVDVQVQTEYFKYSRLLKETETEQPDIESCSLELFAENADLDRKKYLLAVLAGSSEVASYRCIERYLKNPDKLLEPWALVAKHESSLHMQSALANERMVFISSGLGGKKDKLRYLFVMYSKNETLEDYQKKLILNETELLFKKKDWNIEEYEQLEKITKMYILIPVRAEIATVLRQLIENINGFGNFLSEYFIITNMKKLSLAEIEIIITKQQNDNKNLD